MLEQLPAIRIPEQKEERGDLPSAVAPVHQKLLEYGVVQKLLDEVLDKTGLKPFFRPLDTERCKALGVEDGICQYIPFDGKLCGIRIRYDSSLDLRIVKQVLLIEMCNALFMREVYDIDKRITAKQITPEVASYEKEELERLAVARALKIGDSIDKDIMADVDPALVQSPERYLQRVAETGHLGRYIEESRARLTRSEGLSRDSHAGAADLSRSDG